MLEMGDITRISGYDAPTVDIITGGSPCQDLSIAGKRAGLAGSRSGLFMEQVRIIKEMRDKNAGMGADHVRPRYMVWENVPGAFSSNKGEDFRAVLEETARIVDKTASIPRPAGGKWHNSGAIMGDGWSIAWRVHDAQFWGVAQQRRRIALVADFGGQTAPEILFERESVRGDIAESESERERTAGTPAPCPGKAISFQERGGKPGGGKGILIQNERIGSLSTLNNQAVCVTTVEGISGDIANTIDASYYKGCGERAYKEREVVVYGISAYESNAMNSGNPHSGIYKADTSRTINSDGGNPACNQGGMVVLENRPMDSRVKVRENGICQSLDARMGMGGGNVPMVMTDIVRRLTPLECERLQGCLTG